MLWVDQIEDYQNELVKLEDELHFETREEIKKQIRERIDEVNNLLIKVPLISEENMRKKYTFDLGLRTFDEKVEG